MDGEKKDLDIESHPVSGQASSYRPESLQGAEKLSEYGVGTTVQLKRRLQSRHLQMIAIGG